MTVNNRSDVYYDMYDVGINADPYPVYRRLREESPLYYNDVHDFYAVSRYEDVEHGLLDPQTFISGRGGILELIKANIPMPPGVLIFEDPPVHSIHRRLVSRAFTVRRVAELEAKVREFCGRCLDPLVGAKEFDLIADLGALVPMRTIGLLLGIPEGDQVAIRDHVDASLRTEEGKPMEVTEETQLVSGEMFAQYIEWRAAHPSDDLMTELLQVEFEDETGTIRRTDPRRASDLRQRDRGSGQRDHQPADRMGRKGARRPPGSASRAGGRSIAHPERHRGDPSLRAAGSPRRALRRPRRRGAGTRPCPRGASWSS